MKLVSFWSSERSRCFPGVEGFFSGVRWVTFLGLVTLFACPASQVSGQELTAETVRRAIKRGVQYLYDKQLDGGRWPQVANVDSHRGGVEALCILALMNSGESPLDPRIAETLRYLDGIDIDSGGRVSVYSVSLMTMAYAMADPQLYRGRVRDCVVYLERAQSARRAGGAGGWAYTDNPGGAEDGSNTQFALLALHEASKMGIKVNARVWTKAHEYWTKSHTRSGGFTYRGTQVATGSMTCAGISSLVIIDENMEKEVLLDEGRIVCCNDEDRLPMVEDALEWMGRRFSVRKNPADGRNIFSNSLYYYLYGMERAGRLAGVRFMGEHDWYREVAEKLLTLERHGHWVQKRGSHGENHPEVCTSFALLFLAKGKRPVIIGKYQHSPDTESKAKPPF